MSGTRGEKPGISIWWISTLFSCAFFQFISAWIFKNLARSAPSLVRDTFRVMKTHENRKKGVFFLEKRYFLRFSFEIVWKFVRNVVRNIMIKKTESSNRKPHINYRIWYAVFIVFHKNFINVKSEIAGIMGVITSDF